ncbi:lysozyme inhibitor LprI family protein [Labrys neptuniae]|uniref:lysozyme inhibitor LprI family protein n=1 Tax=Labrys neptuniae TaxID=376174 RepID=UPI00288CC61F|nr:lysozyme inhibitor LprI family protein [Labrys neptuniae]MDT3381177.1 lysozyme inhibitor LprI family protein [Labrys neptuniae]
MKALIVVAGLAWAAPNLAFADQNCGDLSNQTDMNICSAKAYSKADGELNSVYKEIEGRLKNDAATKKLLVAAQRGWVSYRDGECKFSASAVQGGTAYALIFNQCRTGLTQARTESLKVYLKCTEGDLDCPVPAAK